MYQNPAQFVAGYQPPPPQPQDKILVALHQIREIKTDNTLAMNPFTLQKILERTLSVLEYLLSGQVSSAHPNQVPGAPIQQDPNMQRVEFFGGPQPQQPQQGYPQQGYPQGYPQSYPQQPPAPQAQPFPPQGAPPQNTPVSNADVQFTPAPQGPISLEGGTQQPGGGAGQAVEFYDGPPGSPHATPGGQRVEFTAGPGAQQQPQQPQQAQGPVSNQPAGTLQPGGPPASVEAGHPVPPTQAPQRPQSAPVQNPFPEQRQREEPKAGASPFATPPDEAQPEAPAPAPAPAAQMPIPTQE